MLTSKQFFEKHELSLSHSDKKASSPYKPLYTI